PRSLLCHWYRCTSGRQSSLLLRQFRAARAWCDRPGPVLLPGQTGRRSRLPQCPYRARSHLPGRSAGRSFPYRDQQQGFEMAQKFVGAPVFREFDGGAADVAVILLQLGLETAEQSESVGGRAGKSGENLVLIETANLLRPMLDDRFPERDLAVASHDNLVVAADAEDGGGADSARSGGFGGAFGGRGCWCVLLHERNS